MKITLLVSMLVSVGGVGSINHVATQVTAKAQEEVRMTMTINSETKDHRKNVSSTCHPTNPAARHHEKPTKVKHHPGVAKKNGWLRAAS